MQTCTSADGLYGSHIQVARSWEGWVAGGTSDGQSTACRHQHTLIDPQRTLIDDHTISWLHALKEWGAPLSNWCFGSCQACRRAGAHTRARCSCGDRLRAGGAWRTGAKRGYQERAAAQPHLRGKPIHHKGWEPWAAVLKHGRPRRRAAPGQAPPSHAAGGGANACSDISCCIGVTVRSSCLLQMPGAARAAAGARRARPSPAARAGGAARAVRRGMGVPRAAASHEAGRANTVRRRAVLLWGRQVF